MKPTPVQKEIIEYYQKQYLNVVAGPGAGKTLCLIERVKYLVKDLKVDPKRILLITFTNKATDEMRSRLMEKLDLDVIKNLNVSTIHSFCYQMLKNDLETKLEFESYSILDDTAQNLFVFSIWDKFSLEFAYKFHDFGSFVKNVADLFLKLKDFNISLECFENYVNKQIEELDKMGPKKFEDYNISLIFKERRLFEAFKVYNKSLQEENYMDYADILQKFLLKLEKNKKFLKKHTKIVRLYFN